MLFKLSLAGIRSRFKDYLVLFSGLVMASAIFYMFEAISTNDSFVESTSVQSAKFVFIFGAVLLALITLVYVSYANTFLLTMRKHDYGVFMMLGARPRKIGLLITLETVMIGLISTVIGILFGTAITKLLSGYLFDKLALPTSGFQAIYPKAIIYTLVFFMILFFISGLFNHRTFVKSSALDLLKSESSTNWKRPKKVVLWVEAVLGVILLAVGYLSMYEIQTLKLIAIPLALVTIVLGTYFIFNSFFVAILNGLQKSKLAAKGLNTFTISQLKFRINDFTKILSVVSLLFALALGAITVGVGFAQRIPEIAQAQGAYAIAVKNPSHKINQWITQLDDKQVTNYQYKRVGNTIYFDANGFNQTPYKYVDVKSNSDGEMDFAKTKIVTLTASQVSHNDEVKSSLARMLPPKDQFAKSFKLVSETQFATLATPSNKLRLVRVKSMDANYDTLNKITNEQAKQVADKSGIPFGGIFSNYTILKSLLGSFEFIGIFLGIAFLAMLASCLMFKILSGTTADARRYEMLNKIGVRRSVAKRSINLQILGLFVLPAVLGIIDVAFGLQLFIKGGLLDQPYPVFGWSLIAFLVLYCVYYIVTIKIYQGFVVPKTKIKK
ncbi:FtsX-like permease family protein [Lentilactobacillus kosonis]|uniref:ABC-type antimicrobial peptide transport system, permease component n=1 Tax=Lentilactobacillus kosonis TaxID=2810561 RepID=A0A401FIG6_9LACO|nr:ABC transporter permease [Lentilactobacillus kosonis]GAY72096.1 ABC-type antimicrobial peptide transport system, permease component [Lentilactobacillus kosonis]